MNLQILVNLALQNRCLEPQSWHFTFLKMQEAREVIVKRDADIAILDDARSTQTKTKALVPGVHLPEKNGFDLSDPRRVALCAFFTMVTPCLAELCGCGVEMPCDRWPGAINSILSLDIQSASVTAAMVEKLTPRQRACTFSILVDRKRGRLARHVSRFVCAISA